jgi:hypothetical protein
VRARRDLALFAELVDDVGGCGLVIPDARQSYRDLEIAIRSNQRRA